MINAFNFILMKVRPTLNTACSVLQLAQLFTASY